MTIFYESTTLFIFMRESLFLCMSYDECFTYIIYYLVRIQSQNQRKKEFKKAVILYIGISVYKIQFYLHICKQN